MKNYIITAAAQMRVDAKVNYDRGHISMRQVNFQRAVADMIESAQLLHVREVYHDAEIEVEGGRATVYEDVDYCAGCGDTTGICEDYRHAENVAKAYLGLDFES